MSPLPPPQQGFFLASKRVFFNFFWAFGWFVLVFAALLAFEGSFDDPLFLGAYVGSEPDGATGKFGWWRQTVSHIMLTGMRTASVTKEENANSNGAKIATVERVEPDFRSAIAAQSLLVFRESVPSFRAPGSLPLDNNFMRRTFTSFVKPHFPLLDKFFSYFSADSDTSSSSSTSFRKLASLGTGTVNKKRHGGNNYQFSSYLADPRAPSQCGSFLFIDGSILGTESSGAFRSGGNGQKENNKNMALFESFVHCGRKQNAPTELGKRMEEYFKSCVGGGAGKTQCVAPGILSLLFLKRGIIPAKTGKLDDDDSTQVLFFDVGAGTEIMSTIAVSALHGYRQSERLERSRKYLAEKKSPEGKSISAVPRNFMSNNDPLFAENVIPPPAFVLPIDAGADFFSATEATRITQLPSNEKLFSGWTKSKSKVAVGSNNNNKNNDGTEPKTTTITTTEADPDRISVVPISFAIGRSSDESSSDRNVFYAIKGVYSKLERPSPRRVGSSDQTNILLAPRVFQCFFRQEELLPSRIANEKNLDVSFNNNQNDEQIQKKLRDALSKKKSSKDDSSSSSIILLSRSDLDKESEIAFSARLFPHVKSFTSSSSTSNKQQSNHSKNEIDKALDDDHDPQHDDGGRHRLIMATKANDNKIHQGEKVQGSAIISSANSINPSGHLLDHDDEHLSTQSVRMHPTSVSSLISQAQKLSQGYAVPELSAGSLSGKRKTTQSAVVIFSDVGGGDSNLLDCGMAVSQTEIVESIVDQLAELKEEGGKTKSSPYAIRSLDAVVVLRPFRTKKVVGKNKHSKESSMNNNNFFLSWCDACEFSASDEAMKNRKNTRQIFASNLIDRTVDALVKAGGVIVSGCTLSTSSNNFSPLHPEKNPSGIAAMKKFLFNDKHDELYDAPFCSVWLSSSKDKTILVEELANLRMDISERLQDDKVVAKIDENVKVAVETGLEEATKSEDDDVVNPAQANTVDHNDAEITTRNKLRKYLGGKDPLMVGLVLVSVAVAFFLMRGVLRNFRGASSSATSKEK